MRFFEEVAAEHKKYEGETILPIRADRASAGYDLRIKKDVTLKPGESVLVFTDVKCFMPENEVLLIYIRSSLGIKYGINLSNGTGVIDSSYYNNPNNGGNIGLPLTNTGDKTVMLLAEERIAQGVFMPYLITNDDETLNDERLGGFGHSGRD